MFDNAVLNSISVGASPSAALLLTIKRTKDIPRDIFYFLLFQASKRLGLTSKELAELVAMVDDLNFPECPTIPYFLFAGNNLYELPQFFAKWDTFNVDLSTQSDTKHAKRDTLQGLTFVFSCVGCQQLLLKLFGVTFDAIEHIKASKWASYLDNASWETGETNDQ